MSDLFFNKIAAALLCSAIGFISINKFASAVVHPKAAEGVAYSLATDTPIAAVEVVEAPFPSAVWIGARDADKGAKVFKKCQSCHTINDGGKDGTGPNLWNIVDRPKAGIDGFSYSTNMKAKGGVWDYAALDEFLEKPKAYIPKTKMGFNGLKKEEDRAALIEYMRMQSGSPVNALMVAAPLPGADQAVEILEDMAEEMIGEVPTMEMPDVEMPDVEEVAPETTEHDAPKPDGGH